MPFMVERPNELIFPVVGKGESGKRLLQCCGYCGGPQRYVINCTNVIDPCCRKLGDWSDYPERYVKVEQVLCNLVDRVTNKDGAHIPRGLFWGATTTSCRIPPRRYVLLPIEKGKQFDILVL